VWNEKDSIVCVGGWKGEEVLKYILPQEERKGLGEGGTGRTNKDNKKREGR